MVDAYLVNGKGAALGLNAGHLILEDFVAEALGEVFAEADDAFPHLLRRKVGIRFSPSHRASVISHSDLKGH